jgi:hypothetical protein
MLSASQRLLSFDLSSFKIKGRWANNGGTHPVTAGNKKVKATNQTNKKRKTEASIKNAMLRKRREPFL